MSDEILGSGHIPAATASLETLLTPFAQRDEVAHVTAWKKWKREERKIFMAADRQRRANEQRVWQEENKRQAEERKLKEAQLLELLLRPKKLRILNRGLLDVLVECLHHRGRNWVAQVSVEPTLPGGMNRKFFDRASGKIAKVVVPSWLEEGMLLEFGADYVSYGGKRTPTRWYAVVLSLSDTEMVVKPYQTLEDALKHKVEIIRVRVVI